jgi:hypothetical protein
VGRGASRARRGGEAASQCSRGQGANGREGGGARLEGQRDRWDNWAQLVLRPAHPRAIIARSVVRSTPGEHVAPKRSTRGCMEGARGLEVEALEVMRGPRECEASAV